MFGRDRFSGWKILLTLSMLLFCANLALAYAGPGAGLELIPYFVGLLIWVGTAFVAFFMYPIYALLKRLRGVKEAPRCDTEIPDPEGSAITSSIPQPAAVPRTEVFTGSHPSTRPSLNLPQSKDDFTAESPTVNK